MPGQDCRDRRPRSGGVARRTRRAFRPELQGMEARVLLSLAPLAEPTADEQYMLELVNRARSDPSFEAWRLTEAAKSDPLLRDATRGWDLGAFVQVLASTAPLPPLAFNTRLIAAARAQDATMLARNDQAHSPSGYLTDARVATAADGQAYYPVSRPGWATGENVFAFSQNVRRPEVSDYIDYLHAGFMIDWGNPDFGHLRNVMNPSPSRYAGTGRLPYNEVGIGILANATPTVPPPSNPENPANAGLDVGPVIVTQEFGWRDGNAFLTGTFYVDRDGDRFYTPGEGLGGVTIVAVGHSGQGTYSAQTWGSGGYSLALPPGTYTVTANGNLPSAQATTVTIGVDNVGWGVSFAAPPAASPTPPPAAQPPAPATIASPAPTPSGVGQSFATPAGQGRRRRLAAYRPQQRTTPIRRPQAAFPRSGRLAASNLAKLAAARWTSTTG